MTAQHKQFEIENSDELDNVMEMTEPQSDLMLCPKKFPLFVAGYGSGKSQGLCITALDDYFKYPGANIGIYAPTYDLLRLVVMSYIEEILTDGGYPFILNNQQHSIHVPGYGKLFFRSLDNPGRIVGYETFRGHADELDTLSEQKAERAWIRMIARNRQKIYALDENGKRIPLLDENHQFVFKNGKQMFETALNKVRAYTTPEGFAFCYKRWVKNSNKDYAIIRASTHSNAHNLPDDYIETLRSSYPEELIDAYIEGRFVNLTSGRVYKNFDRDLNCSAELVKGRENLTVGVDFNVEKGCAAIFVDRQNGLHLVDEIHNSFDTNQTIEILQDRYPKNPITVYPDASGKNRRSSGAAPTATDIALLRQAGFNIEVDYSNPLIKDRVMCVKAKILNGKGERTFFVNVQNCPNAVETLEQQTWDDNGQPDKTSDLDHMGDAIGYPICKRFPIARQNAAFLR